MDRSSKLKVRSDKARQDDRRGQSTIFHTWRFPGQASPRSAPATRHSPEQGGGAAGAPGPHGLGAPFPGAGASAVSPLLPSLSSCPETTGTWEAPILTGSSHPPVLLGAHFCSEKLLLLHLSLVTKHHALPAPALLRLRLCDLRTQPARHARTRDSRLRSV